MAATVILTALNCAVGGFQSPIHRVNGCNLIDAAEENRQLRVSVPYSSGQWLQPYSSALDSVSQSTFQSPIHRVNGCNIF